MLMPTRAAAAGLVLPAVAVAGTAASPGGTGTGAALGLFGHQADPGAGRYNCSPSTADYRAGGH
ncbi:hypothetical protein OH797_37980 (plasmid) [Streptomyces anulatus]|uniref:hypothetical protein n=1 Tax=Streptomyces TaxID=1883 RepID=UPI00117D9C1F|nr:MULTISPECIES: hypothetical protein [Streptomyces]MBT1103584.1 hypothetical protein [Streptomyces sp. Tu10]WTC61000.1 hypothetical protein OG865_00015 [Streptomyces anulatus]WTC68091.1 hypothetical protein OG865_38510 [Streptomyces anulatus]WTC68799.1 hypothetical protein OG882_00015 [Streptomyces anulatus]WTC76557.1 hypothetical protein OG882_40075 [Streptomyces anulatus]